MNKIDINFQIENDPLIVELMKKYKGKENKGSQNFIDIYKNLLGLGYSQEEIHTYFDLDDDYYNFIKYYL